MGKVRMGQDPRNRQHQTMPNVSGFQLQTHAAVPNNSVFIVTPEIEQILGARLAEMQNQMLESMVFHKPTEVMVDNPSLVAVLPQGLPEIVPPPIMKDTWAREHSKLLRTNMELQLDMLKDELKTDTEMLEDKLNHTKDVIDKALVKYTENHVKILGAEARLERLEVRKPEIKETIMVQATPIWVWFAMTASLVANIIIPFIK